MDVGYIWLITILLLMVLGIYVRSNAWINFLNDQKQKKKKKRIIKKTNKKSLLA